MALHIDVHVTSVHAWMYYVHVHVCVYKNALLPEQIIHTLCLTSHIRKRACHIYTRSYVNSCMTGVLFFTAKVSSLSVCMEQLSAQLSALQRERAQLEEDGRRKEREAVAAEAAKVCLEDQMASLSQQLREREEDSKIKVQSDMLFLAKLKRCAQS